MSGKELTLRSGKQFRDLHKPTDIGGRHQNIRYISLAVHQGSASSSAFSPFTAGRSESPEF